MALAISHTGLALRAVLLLSLLDLFSLVCGSPLPLAMPLLVNADYSPKSSSLNHTRTASFASRSSDGLPLPLVLRNLDAATLELRATKKMSKLYRLYSKAKTHGHRFKSLAARSNSVDPTDQDYHRQAAAELTGFSNAMGDYTVELAKATSDKGLANYDKNNDLETLVKNTVNLNKMVLNAATDAVNNIPVLGPILGPIVYQVKCAVDGVLNALENATDALLNALQPLLQGLFPSAVTASCPTGIELLGLCL